MPPAPATSRLRLLDYRRLRAIAAVLLVAEFAIGMGGFLTPRREIFPFASWFLFLLVPHHTADYDLVVHSSHGNPTDPPLPYAQVTWLVANAHSIVTYQLVQQLGLAQARHDEAQGRKLRQQIDALFLQPRVRYELVRDTYQPIERFETGQVRTRQFVAAFTSGEP